MAALCRARDITVNSNMPPFVPKIGNGFLKRGSGMGMPLMWHRRHALLLASQLPDNHGDAALVIQALTELLETFLSEAPDRPAEMTSNVLPFASG